MCIMANLWKRRALMSPKPSHLHPPPSTLNPTLPTLNPPQVAQLRIMANMWKRKALQTGGIMEDYLNLSGPMAVWKKEIEDTMHAEIPERCVCACFRV